MPSRAGCHRAPAISPLTGQPMRRAYCNVPEAAEYAGVSPRTIRRWIAHRWLPAQRDGRGWRIPMANIDDAVFTARLARLAQLKRPA